MNEFIPREDAGSAEAPRERRLRHAFRGFQKHVREDRNGRSIFDDSLAEPQLFLKIGFCDGRRGGTADPASSRGIKLEAAR